MSSIVFCVYILIAVNNGADIIMCNVDDMLPSKLWRVVMGESDVDT